MKAKIAQRCQIITPNTGTNKDNNMDFLSRDGLTTTWMDRDQDI